MGLYNYHSTGAPVSPTITSTGLRCRLPNGTAGITQYDTESNKVNCMTGDDSDTELHSKNQCELYDGEQLVCDSKHCSTHNASTSLLPPPNTTVSPASSVQPSVIKSLSFVDRFLSLWIILVMITGVLTGYYTTAPAAAFNDIQITTVSLPVAFGLWFMMYPVLVKVKYESFAAIFRKRDTYTQMAFSIAANWIIGPFLMLAVAWMCLPEDGVVAHYRNGVIMVGLARCIAMVLIWNQLARGDPEYCAILVVINSILQIVLYAPLAIFFLVVISRQYTDGSFTLSYWTVFRSVLLFLGVPLAAAVLTRFGVIAIAGRRWFDKTFVPIISPLALIALLWTVYVIFTIQGHNIIDNIGYVCRVAVPMVVYFCVMFTLSLLLCKRFGFGYERSVTQAFTASSNNFELAIAVAAATFGVDSPEALAATIGPLVEVPSLLALVYLALWLQPKLNWHSSMSAAYVADTDVKAPQQVDKPNLCFLCVGNSCRSVMSEGWAQQLLSDKYNITSAGSSPSGAVNTYAVQVMHEVGIDMSHHKPRKIDTMIEQGYTPQYVLTVCGDTCPRMPQAAYVLHIPVEDPSHQDPEIPIETQLVEYRRIRDQIREMVLTLPDRFAAMEQQGVQQDMQQLSAFACK